MKLYIWILLTVMLILLIVGMLAAPSPHAPGHDGAHGSTHEWPDDLVERNNLGVGLMGMFKYPEAVDAFADVVADYPDAIDVRVNLAIATLNGQEDGDEARAMEIVDGVLADAPEHLRAHYVAGLLRLYAGEQDAARQHFMFVAERDPSDAFAQYYVGQCLMNSREFAPSLAHLERAIELDPYLRSAYYAASRVALRNDQEAKSKEYSEAFQRLEPNPRARLVEFKYTKMGPKGAAITVGDDAHADEPAPMPEGPVFADAVPLLRDDTPYLPHHFTACDIDADGDVDLFAPGVLVLQDAKNAVFLNDGTNQFSIDLDHPLARIAGVNTALWGDVQNDGTTDVYLCRSGANQLWIQAEDGSWSDQTESFGVANASFNTIDGAMVDADHDGDLDIFCVNADGPNELLNNNLDGTFRPIAQEQGLADAQYRSSRQVLFADLDADRDLDIIIVNGGAPNEVFMNDRLWSYRPATGMDSFTNASIDAAAVVDLDADGRVELYGLTADGILRWSCDDGTTWTQSEGPALIVRPGELPSMLVPVDTDGDGVMEARSDGQYVVLDAVRGPARVFASQEEPRWMIEHPGSGRHAFLAMSFSGREDAGQSMRSNASGIGTLFDVRIDRQWVAASTLRQGTGPGQSLQPVVIGLNGHDRADFISIDWSDGVFQSEVNLAAGVRHDIVEEQRQLSSCPVLFAWNGTKYEFVTDLLGVGGIGYAIGPGEYAEPRPWENVMLPANLLQPKDGVFVLKLSEPMEEACYLDRVTLVAYDVPNDVVMTLDERMQIGGPAPTGQPVFGSSMVFASRAVNDRGEDITAAIRTVDHTAAPIPALDARFIGRLDREHVITMEFDRPLDAAAGRQVLVIDGWVEYPYSQTMFSAWQAGATYDAITVEARIDDAATGGERWVTLLEQFGYPAGMTRQMSVPLDGLSDLPPVLGLRLRTNQEIYVDRVGVMTATPGPAGVRVHECALRAASLRQTGFAERIAQPQRRPDYDYARRAPFWNTRYQTGRYTSIGACTPLVENADNALAIFGPGEEIHLEFDADLPACGETSTRFFVLETVGWC
ncbi:MAG: VCBS repeat-containing protein, partial [Phycisphaerales bacterium]|nr:VCBS repeat-containing protein [Phycisphaerales bacterium]